MPGVVSWPVMREDRMAQRLEEVLGEYVPLSVLDRAPAHHLTEREEFVKLLPVDDVVYADVLWRHRRMARRPERQPDAAQDYVALAVIDAGAEDVDVDGCNRRLVPGDVVLWDCRVATQIRVATHLRKASLLIPRRSLGHLSSPQRARHGLRTLGGAPTAPLLRQLLTSLGRDSKPLSSACRHMRNALLELTFATIESDRDMESESLLPSLCTAVHRWIADHVFDPDLSPAAIAAAHAVSVRTLQRALATQSTSVTEAVRGQRLERARDLLNDPAHTIAMNLRTAELRQPESLLQAVRRPIRHHAERVPRAMPIVRRTATNLIGALARAGAAVYSWHCDAARRLRLVVASRAACKAMPGGAGAGCTKAAGARECPESEASHAAAAADRIVGPLRHLTQKHYERRRGGATSAADEPSPGFQQAFGSYRQTQTNPDKPIDHGDWRRCVIWSIHAEAESRGRGARREVGGDDCRPTR